MQIIMISPNVVPVYSSNHCILMFSGKNFADSFVLRNRWLESRSTVLGRAAKIVFNLMNPSVCGLNNENVYLISCI